MAIPAIEERAEEAMVPDVRGSQQDIAGIDVIATKAVRVVYERFERGMEEPAVASMCIRQAVTEANG